MNIEEPDQHKVKPFMTWRDLTITPLLQLGLWSISVVCTFLTWKIVRPDSFLTLLIFYFYLVAWSLLFLKGIRVWFPFKEGVFNGKDHPIEVYIYSLYGFILITNLYPLYLNPIIPPPLRKLFNQLLGAKFGKGIISVAGRLAEPHFITIDEGAIIGDEALILSHALSITPELTVILRRVHIKSGAVIGAKSLVMPGVIVGEQSMIKAMSLVPMNTIIPPGEVWGGIPARKMGVVGEKKESMPGAKPEEEKICHVDKQW